MLIRRITACALRAGHAVKPNFSGRWSRSIIPAAALTAAALVVPAGGVALAKSGPTDRPVRVPASALVTSAGWFGATAHADGKVTVDSTSSGVDVSPLRAGTSGLGSFACIVETRRHAALIGYTPLTIYQEGNSYEFHWLIGPYAVQHARYLSGHYTFQAELCMTGSGHTWNWYHQWFDGGGDVQLYRQPLLIGWNWGKGVVKGSASAALSFQLSKGGVTIGGSTEISNYGTHSGDTGHDPDMSWPGSWNKYDVNRVNGFYSSAHTFIFQGTGSSEGNASQALSEFASNGTVDFSYGGGVTIRAFCAHLLGFIFKCAKF
jgi:hypothetical protein